MEYLDPKKQQRHKLFLKLGYGLVGLCIGIGVYVLLALAHGYTVKNGQVVQNGMVFLSSQPNPAAIYVNNRPYSATTNTRLIMASGVYSFQLKVSGYRPWSHIIPILGGQVVHYDYPLLFPTKLASSRIAKLSAAPTIASQSPNQQFLVLSSPDDLADFSLYNLTTPKTAPVSLTLPAGLLSAESQTQSWQVVGWADDNVHLLLDHIYDGNQEFIELDTQDPTQSININRTFGVTPTSVSLDNLKYNQFYIYDGTSQTLSTATIGSSSLTPVLNNVLAYKSYKSNIILYTTSANAPSGQVAAEIYSSGSSYLIRDIPTASTYLLNMASYSGADYSVVGSSSDNFVYMYKDVLSQVSATPAKTIPFRLIRLSAPNYQSFAPTAQFLLVENASSVAVYDIFNDIIYHFSLMAPMDAPQTHLSWMDGDRLVYISGGTLMVSDYDNTNRQALTSALPEYNTFFAPDYHSYFSLSQSPSAEIDLNQTSLLSS